jgi:hypothetical protein
MEMKMRNWARLTLVAAMMAAGPTVHAQSFEMRPPDVPTTATGQIIGGELAIPSDWPATFRFLSPEGPCTSTVVGPRAVLTAAHCVTDGAIGIIRLGNEPGIGVTCTHHDDYDVDARLDIALCVAAANIPLANNRPYETLNTDSLRPELGAQVTLLGYGCRQVHGGGPSGALYKGDSVVQFPAYGVPFATTIGGAAVCFGDSGGGAFLVSGASRKLIGVNSQGDIITRSHISAVAHPLIMAFIKRWSTQKNAPICGISPNLFSCRS